MGRWRYAAQRAKKWARSGVKMGDRFAAVAATAEPAFHLSATILHGIADYAKEPFAEKEALFGARNCPDPSRHLDAHTHFETTLSDLLF